MTSLKILGPEERMTCEEYKRDYLDKNVSHILVDVRPKAQADIVKLSHAVNIQLDVLETSAGIQSIEKLIEEQLTKTKSDVNLIVMCRRGNASQKAVRLIKTKLKQDKLLVKDIIGGLEGWVQQMG